MRLPDEVASKPKAEGGNAEPGLHAPTREARAQSVVEGVVDLVTHYRKFILMSVLICLFGTLAGYVLSPNVFVAQSILGVKTADTTLSDYFSGRSHSSLSTTETAQKYVQLFNSETFLIQFAQAVKLREDFTQLNLKRPERLQLAQLSSWKKKLPWAEQEKETAIDPVLVPLEQLGEVLKGLVTAEIDPTDRIHIVARTLDPKTTMVLSNLAATEFERVAMENDGHDISQIEKYLQDKLVESTEQLKQSELKFVEFKKKHTMVEARGDSQSASDELRAIEQKRTAARLQYEENQKLISLYKSEAAASLNQLTDAGAQERNKKEMEIDILRDKIAQLRKQKELMQSQGFAEDHWRMKAVTSEEVDLAAKLKVALAASGGDVGPRKLDRGDKLRKLQQDNDELESRLRTFEVAAAEVKSRLRDAPEAEQEYLNFKRDLDLNYETYSTIKKRLADVEVQRMSADRKIVIESLAALPGRAPKSSLLMNVLFSIFSGLFLGGVLVFGKEFLDPRVKGRDDIEEAGLTFLGEIPKLGTASKRQSLGIETVDSSMLICRHKPESKEAMAFKFVRARILRHPTLSVAGSKIGQIITVTSPGPGEGKSFVSANLAISFSQLGKRTVLVDCDFRNPKAHSFFEVRSAGLVSLFKDESSLEEIIVKTADKNLDVVPAGTGAINATETISTSEFGQLLNSLSKHYEYVILDSPPVNAVVDAAVLATYSDHTILLSSYRDTSRPALLRAHRKVAQLSNSRVYGIVNRSSSIENILLYYGYPYLSRTENPAPKPTASTERDATANDFASKIELKVRER